MLAPISWLKDYVDINVSPEVLAKKLVAIGFEVEEIIYQEKSASKVVVGKIVEVEKHPNADRLRVTQIDIGSGKIQVVTNVPVVGGETIAVALDGAVLADGHQIVKGQKFFPKCSSHFLYHNVFKDFRAVSYDYQSQGNIVQKQAVDTQVQLHLCSSKNHPTYLHI